MLPRQVVPVLSENRFLLQAKSGSMDDVMHRLANVKLAMSGDNRTEVIKVLQQLLQDLVEVSSHLCHRLSSLLQPYIPCNGLKYILGQKSVAWASKAHSNKQSPP